MRYESNVQRQGYRVDLFVGMMPRSATDKAAKHHDIVASYPKSLPRTYHEK